MTFSRANFNKPKIEKFFKFEPACLTAAGLILDMETISNNGRFYISPEGNAYPSMTTVLNSIGDKTFLDDWRKRLGTKEADKRSHIAASRGTDMHKICENYILGDENYLERASPIGRKLFFQIKPLLDENVGIIYAIEQALYSDKHRVAGRSDLIASYKGKRSVVDYKSSGETKKEEWIQGYFIQGAGYGTLFSWMTGLAIEQIVILIGVENSTKAQEFIVPFDDYQKEFEIVMLKYNSC